MEKGGNMKEEFRRIDEEFDPILKEVDSLLKQIEGRTTASLPYTDTQTVRQKLKGIHMLLKTA